MHRKKRANACDILEKGMISNGSILMRDTCYAASTCFFVTILLSNQKVADLCFETNGDIVVHLE